LNNKYKRYKRNKKTEKEKEEKKRKYENGLGEQIRPSSETAHGLLIQNPEPVPRHSLSLSSAH
jgi:hypothetical protein